MTLVVAFAYVLGSIPFALLLTRRWGAPDLRTVGSGNVGAANVVRTSGVRAGVVVLALDVAKGALSVTLARYLSDQAIAPAAAGMAAIIGHIYPVWLRFRGGKGVATACGVFSVLAPQAIAAALAVFAVTAWLTKYVSLASVMGSLALPLAVYLFRGFGPAAMAAMAASVLIVFRHRSNLSRLLAGQERRWGAAARGVRREAVDE